MALHRHHLPAVVVVAGALLAACGGDDLRAGDPAGPGTPVLATTSILADVTSRVGCDAVEVGSIIPAGTDAHEYEPSTRDAEVLDRAELVVAVGLGLEEGLQDALDQASADGVEVVEIGPEVDPIDGADRAGDDPHVWMDPDRMAVAVDVIAEQLQRVDGLPVSAAEVRDCAASYRAELEALAAEMDDTLAVVPADRRELVTNHEALGYFADRFGFEVVGAVIPSTSSLGESNPRDLEDLATTLRRAGVPAVFGETTQPSEVAEQLATLVGGDVEVVGLYTETLGGAGSGAETYTDMMRTDARRVARALGPPPSGG